LSLKGSALKVGDVVSERNKRIEAVIFDLDDTLIDWSNPALTWEEFTAPKMERVRQFLLRRGHQLPPAEPFFRGVEQVIWQVWAEAKQNWQIPSMDEVLLRAFEEMGLCLTRPVVLEALSVYDWGPLPGVVPYDDAIPVLQALRRRRYKIGLVTNSFLPMWMRDVELEAYGLMEYLDVRASSGDVGYIKPHPQIYHHVLERLGAPPQRAVFVGDRPLNDIAGANEVGLISVLISPPHLDRELNGVRPDYTIAVLSELLPILDRLEHSAEAVDPEKGSRRDHRG
jgi:HAD superfamily hydrolase (TIGR01509 family)